MSPAKMTKIKKKVQPPSTVKTSARRKGKGKQDPDGHFSFHNKISTEHIASNYDMARKSPKFTNVTSTDQLLPLTFSNKSAIIPDRIHT
mmetsp:Transcript_41870/g.64083  ORF Transcript_41870/g.64083 Transcript_41870/m.64083 type:complete len:89 (+) Transcript_41870:3818-4084(+)